VTVLAAVMHRNSESMHVPSPHLRSVRDPLRVVDNERVFGVPGASRYGVAGYCDGGYGAAGWSSS
jgi:hypothetical protein